MSETDVVRGRFAATGSRSPGGTDERADRASRARSASFFAQWLEARSMPRPTGCARVRSVFIYHRRGGRRSTSSPSCLRRRASACRLPRTSRSWKGCARASSGRRGVRSGRLADILHHAFAARAGGRELARVTRPGGMLLVVDQIAPVDPLAALGLNLVRTCATRRTQGPLGRRPARALRRQQPRRSPRRPTRSGANSSRTSTSPAARATRERLARSSAATPHRDRRLVPAGKAGALGMDDPEPIRPDRVGHPGASRTPTCSRRAVARHCVWLQRAAPHRQPPRPARLRRRSGDPRSSGRMRRRARSRACSCASKTQPPITSAPWPTARRSSARPRTTPYGERQYTAEDPGGHHWTFSQSIADVDPASWGGTLVTPST